MFSSTPVVASAFKGDSSTDQRTHCRRLDLVATTLLGTAVDLHTVPGVSATPLAGERRLDNDKRGDKEALSLNAFAL